jgi:hypothetical protein
MILASLDILPLGRTLLYKRGCDIKNLLLDFIVELPKAHGALGGFRGQLAVVL